MSQRYFITSAVPGAALNVKFLKSIKNYCKRRSAKLLIIPTLPVMKGDAEFDPRIPQSAIVMGDLALNEKIRIDAIQINPQQVDPVTGLARNSQTDGSFIFASPKQRLKLVANSNIKLPHALMTPGAVTLPTSYRDNRAGRIATMDHINGGLIVEIVDSKEYHFRQVQADADGSFIDLGVKFHADGKSTKAETEAVVGGDLHCGETDPDAERVLVDLIKILKPKYTILHDVLNGHSVPHHDKDMSITRAIKAQEQKTSIESEVKELALKLKMFGSISRSLVIVRSNHDEWIDQYLEGVDYRKDSINHIFALELALAMARGSIPLEYGVKKFANIPNIKWLRRDEDLKLTPKKIQMGAHGDKGSNGARGSTNSMELAHAKSISGHTHTPEILRGAWVVGTTSILNPPYLKGASSWLHTHCILYSNGSRQMINCVYKKWRM